MPSRPGQIAEPDLPEDARALLPLTPAVFYVLFALSREEQHGYAIMKFTETMSNGLVSMGPGTLYSTIQRLVKLGLIEETSGQDHQVEQGRPRRFYRITKIGLRTLDFEIKRMSDVLKQVRLNRLVHAAERES